MSKAKRNGGYVLVDFTGVNIESEAPVVIPGIFETCKKAFDSNKPIYIINLVAAYDGVSANVSPMVGYATHPIQQGVVVDSIIDITTIGMSFIVNKTNDTVLVTL